MGMAYRGEPTSQRAYEPYGQRDEREQAAQERADVPVYPPLWPPDSAPDAHTQPPEESARVLLDGRGVAVALADGGVSEAETARIPAISEAETTRIPAISEAETARISAPSAMSEAETARIPAPIARPSAGPAPAAPVAPFGAAPSPVSAPTTPWPAPPAHPGDARGLADLPTARIPAAGPVLASATAAAPARPTLPPIEQSIWTAPTAPLAPQSQAAAPTATPAPQPTRLPTLAPASEPTPVRTARWGATGVPAWAEPARPAPPSTPLNAPASGTGAPLAPFVVTPPNDVSPADAPTRRPTLPPASRPTPAPDEAPVAAPATRRVGDLGLRLAVIGLLVALLLALVGVGAAYGYGVNQSDAPQRAIGAYCDALRQANYTAAYDLLSPAAQARIPRAQYVSDEQARDTFYGRVTACQGQMLGADGRFIFWRQPTLVMYALTLERAGVAAAHIAPVSATGHVALTPDGAVWRVSAVDPTLLGIDLDPLTVVSDFCQALIARAYGRAYDDLSPALQREQGAASAFANAFAATGNVTRCAGQLSTYRVAKDDRSAALELSLSVSGALPGAAKTTVTFTLSAALTLVRTTQGWRVDSLKLGDPTPQG